jgi:rhodanese-related sulfurtransferase
MRQRFVRSLAGAVAIVLVGGALGLLANAVSSAGIPLLASEAAPGTAIGLAAGRQVHRAGGAAFVDARPRDDYLAGHIEGALSVPLGERARELGELRRELPRTRPLVAYCEGGACTSAFELSAWLAANGWRDVSVLADGYPAWEAAGFPVTRGAAP